MLKCSKSHLIRLAEDVATLRVAQNDPIASAVLDHFRTDLAWKKVSKKRIHVAVCLPTQTGGRLERPACECSAGYLVAVLGSDPEPIGWQLISGKFQIARRATDHNVWKRQKQNGTREWSQTQIAGRLTNVWIRVGRLEGVAEGLNGGLVTVHLPVTTDEKFATHPDKTKSISKGGQMKLLCCIPDYYYYYYIADLEFRLISVRREFRYQLYFEFREFDWL